MIRQKCPYSNVIMIGDGITDLEAVQVRRGWSSTDERADEQREMCPYRLPPTPKSSSQVSGGADLFIGYGGVIARPAVEAEADWFVTDYAELEAAMKRYKVKGERGGGVASILPTLCRGAV